MRKLVLFDIDGTLVWTNGAGRAAIRHALLAEMGAMGPIDGFRFEGKTDPQIIQELMTAARHPEAASDAHIAAVCRRYVALLGGELRQRARGIRVFPGVPALLDTLATREDTLLGLLTGNLADGARLKLEAAGIDPARFRIGAYGSDSAVRLDLPPVAVRRATPIMGRVPVGEDIVIIGDTPADVTCGQSVGARAIGVATGRYAREELLTAGAYAAFADLAEIRCVLDAIYA